MRRIDLQRAALDFVDECFALVERALGVFGHLDFAAVIGRLW
jgi:hypothetical protein